MNKRPGEDCMRDTMLRLGATVAADRNGIIGFLRELIALSREGEPAVQAQVSSRLERIGCEIEVLRYRPDRVPLTDEFAVALAMDDEERESIMARFTGSGGGRSVILFAHPDSEPVAHTAAWRHDPFGAIIEEGRIHGWGVADDLAGVATMVMALEVVRKSGFAPAGDVTIASTPSKRHARGVAAVLHHGISADAAVYLHPAESGAGLAEVKAFSSGLLEFTIEVGGEPPQTNEPGHTIFAHRAVNPLDKAWLVHGALRELGERRAARVRHPRLDEAVGRSTNILISGLSCGEAGQFNRVARTCTLRGSVSYPPSETMAQVQGEFEAALAAACARDRWLAAHPAKLMWLSGVPGAEVPPTHALFEVVAAVIAAEMGRPPFVNALHTSSDIRNPIVQRGIPTVGLGPLSGDLTQNGGHDEWVDVEDYLRGVKVTAGLIVAWCGTG
jgi:acetylornithine deacetylase